MQELICSDAFMGLKTSAFGSEYDPLCRAGFQDLVINHKCAFSNMEYLQISFAALMCLGLD